jgi:Ca-activated chloride channel family protein
MNFHWPLVLWALLIPAALLVRDVAHRRRAAVAPAQPKILRAEATHSSFVISPSSFQPAHRPRFFLIAGLILAVLSLARPQWGRLDEPVFDQSREILLALDLSRSMTAPDVKPSRLDRAKLLIASLLERLEGERVGLVVFAGTSFLQSPLSADYEILRDFLPALGPDFLPQGGSNYRALLQTSLDAFGQTDAADRYLIVLSDGEATDDNWRRLADELKKKSIRVLGLGVGTADGAMIPDGAGAFVKDERGAVVLSKLESRTLQQLADTTGGVYADASGWVDLAQLIESTVATGRKGEFRERSRVRLAERFQWALAPALALFALSFWREFPVRPKARALRARRGQSSGDREQKTGNSIAASARSTALRPVTVLCVLSSALSSPPPARAADGAAASAADTIASPLGALIGHLAARPALAPREYAELANATLTYGERLQSAQQPVPESPIRDALAAIAAGERADAKAADWPDLRAKLEKFLEPPPEPEKKPDEKKSDEQKQPENQDKNQPQQEKPQDSSDAQQQKQPERQKADSEKSSSQSQNPQSPGGEKSEPPPSSPRDQQQSAFGDMSSPEQKNPPQPTPEPSGETQKIGGAQETKTTAPTNPNLALPLQKLDQVRDRDSPGQLFQLLQEDKRAPEKPKKDW